MGYQKQRRDFFTAMYISLAGHLLHTTTLLTVAASDDESGTGIIIGGLSMDGTYQGLKA